MGLSIASQRLTADGIIGLSGKPIRVYNVEMLNGGSAGNLVLRNGTSASDTVFVNKPGVNTSQTDTFNWAGGKYFPGGCFFDKDANTTAIVIEYELVQA